MNAIRQLLTDHIGLWTAADTEKRSGRGRSAGNAASVYGIKKLRELILELAVRGKLVPQNANDEPASELLKRIQAAKENALPNGAPKKTKQNYSAFSGNENSALPPAGWSFAPLADLVNILNGRAYKKDELLDTGTPVLRVGNLFTSDHWYYSNLKLEPEKYCNAGDLLFAWSASFGPFIWSGEKSIYHYHIWKLDLYSVDSLYKQYLYTFLLEQTQKIKAAGHGVSMIHMTKEKMEKLVVPVPPLAEQHRIVAKVDELMALCDQLETRHNNAAAAHEKLVSHLLDTLTQSHNVADFSANWQRIAAHFGTLFATEASIDALKQSLLQLAVMGKLVLQDPNDEPASELLKRIKTEKEKLIAVGRIKKEKPLPPITENEKPYSLPQGWEWVRLGKLGDWGAGATPARGNSKYFGGDIPWFKSGELSADYISKSEETVTELALKECSLRANSVGDVLIAMYGATIGKTAILAVPATTNQAVCACTPLGSVTNRYLLLLLKALKKNFIGQGAGGAQPNISREKIIATITALPPLAEQYRIVAKVDELMALCEQLKSRITAANHLQQKLADVMVEQAVA